MKAALKRHGLTYLAALVTALFSLHQLLGASHYIPVEINDEPSHTFIDCNLFFKFLKAGQFYAINLYNNFGTPVIGDAVAIPWAPHGITYALFNPITAILINKVFFIFLTFVAFYHLSLLFQGSRIIATLIAFLSYSNPAFLWFIQNHPHQPVLAYFAIALLCVEWVIRRGSVTSFAGFFGAVLLILAGCGINGAFLSVLFIGFYILLNLSRIKIQKFLFLNFAFDCTFFGCSSALHCLCYLDTLDG